MLKSHFSFDLKKPCPLALPTQSKRKNNHAVWDTVCFCPNLTRACPFLHRETTFKCWSSWLCASTRAGRCDVRTGAGSLGPTLSLIGSCLNCACLNRSCLNCSYLNCPCPNRTNLDCTRVCIQYCTFLLPPSHVPAFPCPQTPHSCHTRPVATLCFVVLPTSDHPLGTLLPRFALFAVHWGRGMECIGLTHNGVGRA